MVSLSNHPASLRRTLVPIVLDIIERFEGTLTTSVVYPREVIKMILEKDAAAVIFVHNHPLGNPNPSNDDQNITRKLKAACETIDFFRFNAYYAVLL